MKVSLDHLINHQIKNQYGSLDGKSNGQTVPKGYLIESCKKYEIIETSQSTQDTAQTIENTTQSVFIYLAIEGKPIKIPKGVAFCGGAKGAIIHVDVAVCPPNPSIQDRVAEYFVSQKTPPMMISGPMVVYDKISINGEVIR